MQDIVLHGIYIASVLTFFIGALISLAGFKLPRNASILSNSAVCIGSLIALIFSLSKLLFLPNEIISFNWISSVFPFDFVFSIDNLSAFFILIISFISFTVSIYSYGFYKNYLKYKKSWTLLFLNNLFIISMLILVSTGNLFFFLLAWELMSLISYFMVVYFHENVDSQKSGSLYVIMTHIGTAFIITAFVLLYKFTGTALFNEIDVALIPGNIRNIIFLFALIGFGTKAGIIPLHIWLPNAYASAPDNMPAIMSGVMSKMAIFGIVRIVFLVLRDQYLWWGIVLLILGATSTFFGINYALMENNIKKLLGYSSIENIGIILIGLGSASMASFYNKPSIAAFSIMAALLHVFNHSVFKSLLFLGAGTINSATGTSDIEKLGGLIKKMPYTAVFVLIGALSISALPPFNGFISEWMIYQSIFENISLALEPIKILFILVAAVLGIAGALAAFTFVKFFGIAFLAVPRSNHSSEAKEVSKSMLAGMLIVALTCLVVGIIPGSILKLIGVVSGDIFNNSTLIGSTSLTQILTFKIITESASISTLTYVFVTIIILLTVMFTVKYLKKKAITRVYGTWDCGYISLNPKMQYTATGFSKIMRIIFRGIFKPQRELKIENNASIYYITSAKYSVSTEALTEKYLYEPIVKFILTLARRLRIVIQTGSIHAYLLYIFIAIVAMLVYFTVA